MNQSNSGAADRSYSSNSTTSPTLHPKRIINIASPAAPQPHQPSPSGSASATSPPEERNPPGSAGVPPASLFLMEVAERQRDFARSHPVGVNRNGQTEGEPRPVPGRSKWWRGPRLRQALCGRDARAPRGPSSHDIVTPRGQDCRSILVLHVVEAGPAVFWSIRVYSCPFVVHLH